MINASSQIVFGTKRRIIPGLLLARFESFPDGITNSFRVRTRTGRQLIVADLNNKVFPLDLKTIITESGIYLAVQNFDLYIQPHGLFLTSHSRTLCPKFDETPGILLSGTCSRIFTANRDSFSFSGVPAAVSLN
jgi:hypothetical protein